MITATVPSEGESHQTFYYWISNKLLISSNSSSHYPELQNLDLDIYDCVSSKS